MKSWANQLQQKTISVIGVGGRTGRSVLAYLSRHPIKSVIAYDQAHCHSVLKDDPRLHLSSIVCELGLAKPELAYASDLWVVTPGIDVAKDYIQLAIARGIEVISEIELTSRLISGDVLAITGTNGKSTTTALLGHILQSSQANQREVFVGGNLGTPWIEALLAEHQFKTHVIEVSSFQAELMVTFQPHMAALTNIQPEHLNRHGDFSTYQACKRRVFEQMKPQQKVFVNADCPNSSQVIDGLAAEIIVFSGRGHQAAHYVIADQRCTVGRDHSLDVSSISLLGQHNLENVALAVGMAWEYGVSAASIGEALPTFKALPHRLEPVDCVRGVWFVNDSKSTTAKSSMSALDAITTPVVIMLGGRPKTSDFAALVKACQRKAKAVLLFGELAQKYADAFACLMPHSSMTMAEAFDVATNVATQGDTILLSPAATSFDEFNNFEQRGDAFKRLVVSYAGGACD